MRFGLQTRGTYEEVLAAARWAESTDIDAFALPDHYMSRGDDTTPAWDNLAQLAGLARETERLTLASLVSPVTFRHPAVLYKMGVTIDEMSDGRMILGLGAGWLDEEFENFGIPYPSLKTRMEMYEEAMAYLRAAITPGAHPFDGKHYKLADFDPHPQPKNLRLMGGGAGKPKARRIVALYGDEYNLYARQPDEYSEIRQLTRDEAEQAGRDPDEIMWTSASPALAASSKSEYEELLETFAGMVDQEPEQVESTFDERGYPHGYGDKPAEMMGALGEAGCELFYMQIFAAGPDAFESILGAYRG